MTYNDLPPDWPTRPVTDPDITADLLDLVVRDADRVDGALCILLCGEEGQLVQPMVVPRPPTRMSREQRGRVFASLEHLAAEEDLRGGILVAIAREKGPFVTDTDRAWHEAAMTTPTDAVDRLRPDPPVAQSSRASKGSRSAGAR